MVRQILLIAGVAAGLTASAQDLKPSAAKASLDLKAQSHFIPAVKAKMNDGSIDRPSHKAASTAVQWKRPAGQFWCTGQSLDESPSSFYYFTPLLLRPWTEYTFENVSTVSTGSPSWEVEYVDVNKMEYVSETLTDQNVTKSYILYETPSAPLLSYRGQTPYPSQYAGKNLTQLGSLPLCVGKDANSVTGMGVMPVCSHYWSLCSRQSISSGNGLVRYTGAASYDPNDDEGLGYWFGTNNQGINAAATRFEKPDKPYLLNSVLWYYQFSGTMTKDVPLKAYVFKTVNDALEETLPSGRVREVLEVGELIATSEFVVPAQTETDDNFSNFAVFEFKEKNPVTGAETAISLEIDDDITVIVTGFDAYCGEGASITSAISDDEFDEGYGNLGFLGSFDVLEDGTIDYGDYGMIAMKDFFQSSLPNTTVGVLADVSYPWIVNGLNDPQDEVKLSNDGEDLNYILFVLSTSETSDFEVTFNGEEECDWLEITDVYDEYEENESGEEEFSGLCGIQFTAAPNPEDVNRTCVVKLSIPGASYEITFLQGTNNMAVDAINAEGAVQYFDLAGRRVVNPEKGVYVKVSGNKAEKVVL